MAHEFESGFFRKEPAWHKLGVVLDEAPSIEDAIVAAGLNWHVETRPLYYQNINSHQYVEAAERRAVVRLSDESLLGTVGPVWTPLQNERAFAFFEPLVRDGVLKLESAGSLRNGRIVWILGKFEDEGTIGDGDKVGAYFLLSQAHDGSRPVVGQFTNVRVVCWNTLSVALADVQQQLKIRHTTNVELSVMAVRELINAKKRQFETSLSQYRKLAGQKLSIDGLEKYVIETLKLPETPKGEKKPRVIAAIQDRFEHGAGAHLDTAKGTYWGAFNAITEWQDYYRGHEKNRLYQSWFAQTDLKERALSVALNHCGVVQ